MVTLFGIPNCDTVKKARNWLTDKHIDYEFHDYKKHGLDPATLEQWILSLGWEILLNKRSMTWKKLPAETRQDIDREKAMKIMLDNLSIIKRPVLNMDGQLLVGFDCEQYSKLLLTK